MKTNTNKLFGFLKLQKAGNRIAKCFLKTFETTLDKKRNFFVKSYNRYLKKFINFEQPLSKVVTVIGLSLAFRTNSEAQCRNFVNADTSNPLKTASFPFQLFAPVFVDIDNDGDLDCYGEYIDRHDSLKFAFLKNTGTKRYPSFEFKSTGGFPDSTGIEPSFGNERIEGMVFIDIDGDGDYDCFVGTDYNWQIEYFKNVGDKSHPVFVHEPDSENPLWRIVGGSYGLFFNFIDIDGDGDYDLSATDLYYFKFYENKGTKTNPEFVKIRQGSSGFFGGPQINNHTIDIDWNKDGLIDLIQGSYTGAQYYKNNGTANRAHFKRDTSDAPKLPSNFNSQYDYLYSLVDLNDDGFFEAFSYYSEYAVTSPVAFIKAKQRQNFTRLDAYPKGNYSYQWMLNGKRIHNADSDFIKAKDPGNYAVEITDSCGTGISLPFDVQPVMIGSTTSAENLSAANKNISPQIFPNPFSSECVLNLDKAFSKDMVLRVVDLQGRTVLTLKPQNSIVKFGRELHSGTYFVEITQNNKVIFQQTILKQ